MRSPDELKMDRTIALAKDLAVRTQAYPRNGLLKRIDYRLVAETDDMLDFLLQVEKFVEEVEATRRMYAPNNPDQLSLF
jgi:hypothetical protein